MARPGTLWLVGAAVLGGLLAGADLDRALVANAAWRDLGALAWAEFSRHADLSVRGLTLYPILGVGSALLSTVAATRLMTSGRRPRPAALPSCLAALFSIGGLLATIKAAPIMLGIARLGQDTARLQLAMDGFEQWGDIRAGLQVLAFFASLWALSVLGEEPRTPRPPGP